MSHRSGLLIAGLIGLGSVAYGWESRSDNRLQLLGYPLTAHDQAVLNRFGASFAPNPAGFSIVPDERGALALFQLRRDLEFARDICLENQANVETTKTADGNPYARKTVDFEPTGKLTVRVSSDPYRWVFDPINPNADHQGPHMGYVAMPNVNTAQEEKLIAALDRQAAFYDEALTKIEKLNPRLLVRHLPYRGETVCGDDEGAPPSEATYAEIMASMKQAP